MTYRPSPVRARHQVERHVHPAPTERVALSPLTRRVYGQFAAFRGALPAAPGAALA